MPIGWIIAIIIVSVFLLGIIGLSIAAIKWFRKHVKIEKVNSPSSFTLDWKKELMWEHVQVIVQYELLDTENPEEAEDVLNTIFLPIYNGVILIHKISKQLFLNALRYSSAYDDIDLDNITEEELLQLVPSVYCEDANISHLTLGGVSMYSVDFNKDFEHFEGDNYREFFE